VLPQQKVEIVQTLRASGRTVAVGGDGINDAAAMANADVSIALGSATDLARATADIVLLNDDLCDLVFAIEVAQESMRVIEQNKTIVVAPNVAAIAYGALAVLNPIAGVVINNGVALVAALNSLRPLPVSGRVPEQQTAPPTATTYQVDTKMTGL
jgi:P-type E1-E2 ATPase